MYRVTLVVLTALVAAACSSDTNVESGTAPEPSSTEQPSSITQLVESELTDRYSGLAVRAFLDPDHPFHEDPVDDRYRSAMFFTGDAPLPEHIASALNREEIAYELKQEFTAVELQAFADEYTNSGIPEQIGLSGGALPDPGYDGIMIIGQPQNADQYIQNIRAAGFNPDIHIRVVPAINK